MLDCVYASLFMEANTEPATMILLKQVFASLFFGISSILIVMVNKIVLTTYKLVNAH